MMESQILKEVFGIEAFQMFQKNFVLRLKSYNCEVIVFFVYRISGFFCELV